MTEVIGGSVLFRFHKDTARYPANSFNPNADKRIDIVEHGSRFNPFPGAPCINVPTLYAADTFQSAALESVFHQVEHKPSAPFPAARLGEWCYSRLLTRRKLVVFNLINPTLRSLLVPERHSSILESELIHSLPDQYPNTRTWARYLHDSLLLLDGLAWRPRLGGTGAAYVFFGDRCGGDLEIAGPAVPISSGPGLGRIRAIARAAGIVLI